MQIVCICKNKNIKHCYIKKDIGEDFRLDRLLSLKYREDDTFDAKENFDILGQNIPDSSIGDEKVSFIRIATDKNFFVPFSY